MGEEFMNLGDLLLDPSFCKALRSRLEAERERSDPDGETAYADADLETRLLRDKPVFLGTDGFGSSTPRLQDIFEH